MATPTRIAPPPPPIRKGQVVAVEAIQSYKAQKPGELTIEDGDLLFILDQTDANWWRARLEDKEGLVPSNYLSTSSARVPIVEGARRGNIGLVQECLTAGVSINALDKSGCSALHAASQAGHIECVKALLSCSGVQLDLQNKVGDTPLHCASYRGHDEVVRLLLDHGADKNIENKDGFTARNLGRRPSIVGVFDEALVREKGSQLSSFADEEYGNNEDSD